MKPFLIRCSSIGQIMGTPRSIPSDAPANIKAIVKKNNRTDEEKIILEQYKESCLSETAKSYLNKLAKEFVYSYRKDLEMRYLEKGKECEQDLIDLANMVFGLFLEKNSERRSTDLITGEPDLILDEHNAIWDIKNAWSLDTFPATPEEAHNDDYEWQLRGYLHLFDKQYARVVYGLVNTPEHLIRYEQRDLHIVSHLPANMRITVCDYVRDMKLEQKMLEKCRKAQDYIAEQIKRIQAEHNFGD
jgi:hypothetical protein